MMRAGQEVFLLDDNEWQLALLVGIASDCHKAAGVHPSALMGGDDGVGKARRALLGIDNN